MDIMVKDSNGHETFERVSKVRITKDKMIIVYEPSVKTEYGISREQVDINWKVKIDVMG